MLTSEYQHPISVQRIVGVIKEYFLKLVLTSSGRGVCWGLLREGICLRSGGG